MSFFRFFIPRKPDFWWEYPLIGFMIFYAFLLIFRPEWANKTIFTISW